MSVVGFKDSLHRGASYLYNVQSRLQNNKKRVPPCYRPPVLSSIMSLFKWRLEKKNVLLNLVVSSYVGKLTSLQCRPKSTVLLYVPYGVPKVHEKKANNSRLFMLPQKYSPSSLRPSDNRPEKISSWEYSGTGGLDKYPSNDVSLLAGCDFLASGFSGRKSLPVFTIGTRYVNFYNIRYLYSIRALVTYKLSRR